MRVSARIISGAVILMILALLAIVHVSLIGRIRVANTNLAVSFHAAEDAEGLVDDLELVRSLSQNLVVSPAPYRNRDGILRYPEEDLKEARRQFEDAFAELQETLGPGRSTEEVDALQSSWVAYLDRWTNEVGPDSSLADELIVVQLIEPVLGKAALLSETINRSFSADVENATRMAAQAEKVSWVAAGIALVLGIVWIFLLRTINDSLRRLTRGTRMLAQGQFWHRLPAGGRDEFSELAADFNSMSERLGQLDSMKKEFVSHVSHELKAPLASVRQTFHLLLEEIPGPLNPQQKRLLRLSNNSAERLTAMVGNLLDVSRMEAGSMEYMVARVDLLALARTVMEEFEVQAAEKQVTIQVEPGLEGASIVECDRDRMIQVIGNLFDNALKFSPRGAAIVASIRERGTGRDRFLVFSVRDSGIGVPDNHKEKIFRKFHQVIQGRKMSGQGVGLGLAICNSIVEAHRGRIWVEDNPEGGSIFSFELPAMVKVEATTA